MLWGRVAKYVLWKAEHKWKARGWCLAFGGKYGKEYVLRGMMWADNCSLRCDNNERLTCMVNDIIEELLDVTWNPSRSSCGGQSLTVTPAIADRSEGFTHRAAPPQRRTRCRLSLCIFSFVIFSFFHFSFFHISSYFFFSFFRFFFKIPSLPSPPPPPLKHRFFTNKSHF